MNEQDQLDDLLDRCEELADRGQDVSIDEICRDCPEMAPLLREKWAALGGVDAFMAATHDTAEETVDWTDAAEPAGRGSRYEPLELHAQGGLGEVYVARENMLHRKVALKRLRPERRGEPQARARFLLEAQLTSRLEHPGVVPVYGIGVDEKGQPFYAMRFLGGGTLDDAIKQLAARRSEEQHAELHLARNRLVKRFVTVCQTMAYAHDQGIVHRDLKPSNIMLGEYGETLVVDWGLAKLKASAPAENDSPEGAAASSDGHAGQDQQGTVPDTGAATREGQVKGSPAFMSPEQARGAVSEIGPASDIYSLGATLYALLTGRPPVQDENILRLLERVERGEFPPPRELDPSIPRPLEAICLKAMQHDPTHRYATAGEMAADLERYGEGEPVTAYPEPWTDRSRRWLKRHRTVVVGAAAAVVVAIVGLAVVAVIQNRSNQALAEKNEQLAKQKNTISGQKAALENTNTKLTSTVGQLNSANTKLVKAVATERELRQEAERLRAAAERDAYRIRLQMAEYEYEAGRLDRSLAALRACPEKLRGWEWNYLYRLHFAHAARHEARTTPIAVAMRPDGKMYAVAYSEGATFGYVDVFETATGRLIRRIEQPPERLMLKTVSKQLGVINMSLAWSDDNRLVIAETRCEKFYGEGKRKGLIHVLTVTDPANPKTEVTAVTEFGLLGRAVVSSNARYVAIALPSGNVRIQDMANPRAAGVFFRDLAIKPAPRAGLLNYDGKPPYLNEFRMAFTADGEKLAVARGHVIHLVESKTGDSLHKVELNQFDSVQRIALSPKGERVAFALYDHGLRIWKPGEPNARFVEQLQAEPQQIAFHGSGQTLAAMDRSGRITFWSVVESKGSLPARRSISIPAHTRGGEAIVFHPKLPLLLSAGSSLVAAAGRQQVKPEIKQWPLDRRSDRRLIGRSDAVAYSPDGRYRLHLAHWDLVVVDRESGKEVFTEEFSSRPPLSLGPRKTEEKGPPRSIRFSPGGNRFAVWGSGWIEFWSFDDGKAKRISAVDLGKLKDAISRKVFSRSIYALDFLPQGKQAVVTNFPEHDSITLLDVQTGNVAGTWRVGHTVRGGILQPGTMRFSYSSYDSDKKRDETRFFDLNAGQELEKLRIDGFDGLQFTRDGKLLVVSGKGKGETNLLQVRSVKEGAVLADRLLPEFGMSYRFSPDGRRIIVWGDGSGELWVLRARTGEILFRLNVAVDNPRDKSIAKAVFSPDGHSIAVRHGFYFWEFDGSPKQPEADPPVADAKP